MARIELTQDLFSLVDDVDADWLSQFKWRPSRSGQIRYATTSIGRKTLLMHREILDAPAGLVVDHVNCDGLDNRRSNLRLCTQKENVRRNRPQGKGSKYKGVSRTPGRKPWIAIITVDGKQKNLGRFLEEKDAAKAYDMAAKESFGQFAYLNFPDIPNPLWLQSLAPAEKLAIEEYFECHPLSKKGVS